MDCPRRCDKRRKDALPCRSEVMRMPVKCVSREPRYPGVMGCELQGILVDGDAFLRGAPIRRVNPMEWMSRTYHAADGSAWAEANWSIARQWVVAVPRRLDRGVSACSAKRRVDRLRIRPILRTGERGADRISR